MRVAEEMSQPPSPAGAAGGGRLAAEKIRVSVRLRPMNRKELENGDTCEWECISNTTVLNRAAGAGVPAERTAYSFDRVFGSSCSSRQVYEEGAKEVALSVVSGVNSSVFAYGQTSSGKTYTMTGITQYSVVDIYEYMQQHDERQFTLKFSAVEIYNEAVRDLLSADPTPLRLLDDPEKGTVIDKLTEETLEDQDHFRELLAVCEAQRQIGETSLNEMSSRSHQILRLTVESSSRDLFSRESSSKLVASVNFVDLAGSERASQVLSAGARLKEGSHINRSLLTLGTVIRKLSKGRTGHIPYRDSKLTRILQSSLGGNARTAIICTMSPARAHMEQSRNTLLFATCAKEVATNARVNVVISDKALIKHLQKELARLEAELRHPGSTSSSPHVEALKQKEAQIKKLESEKMEIAQQRDVIQSRLKQLLKGVGDDQSDYSDHPKSVASSNSNQSSRPSTSHTRTDSGDALSAFEDTDYQDQDFLQRASFSAMYADIDRIELTRSSSKLHLDAAIPEDAEIHNMEEEEEQCKEVQFVDLNREFNLLHSDPEGLTPVADEFGNLNSPSPSPSPSPHPFEAAGYDGLQFRDGLMPKSRSCTDVAVGDSHSFFGSPAEARATTDYNESGTMAGKGDRKHSLNESPLSECSAARCFSNPTEAPGVPKHEEGDSVTDIACVTPHKGRPEGDGQTDVDKKSGKDAGSDTIAPVVSGNPWQWEFEKKRQEIIELWHKCNVSIVHRTSFYVLFKGDPADSIYLEVEHRRLTFLSNAFAGTDSAATVAASLKELRHEREMLHKTMLKKLRRPERESIYGKWDIPLNTKQRRLQLSRRIWTSTDGEHVRESAELVARLIGLLEPGTALREMFGLSLSAVHPHRHRKSSSWLPGPF